MDKYFILKKIKKNNTFIHFAFIAAIITIAYGIILLPFFSLRNDNISYFLPTRLFITDALRHHEFLLWNPFFGGSYPMHSDMQGAVWNPIVLILAWLFGYNHTVYAIEMLLYYIIGSIGFYCFISIFTKNAYTKITLAICFGCCGFAASIPEYMTWIESFAFLPWAAYFYYSLLITKKAFFAVGLSLAMWLLVVCGYPSFFIVLLYIFLGIFLTYAIKLFKNNHAIEIIQICKWLLFSFILFIIIALPAIQSFLEFLTYYPRGDHANTDFINHEKFSFVYLVSMIFPAGFLANEKFTNFQDAGYFGLLPLILLIVQIGRTRLNSFQNVFLVLGSFLIFLFSVGRSTPFRLFSANNFLLLNKFGFSHGVRVFLVMATFIFLTPAMDRLFTNLEKTQIKKIKKIAIYILISLTAYLLIMISQNSFHFIYNYSNLFYISSVVFEFIILFFIIFLSHIFFEQPKLVMLFIVGDMLVSVFLTIPITGLSKVHPSVYNQYAEKFYNINANTDLLNVVKANSAYLNSHNGLNAFKIIPNDSYTSNTHFESYFKYISDSNNYKKLLSSPFAFKNDSTQIQIEKINLGYNFIDIDVKADKSCQLIIQQNYYKRWKSRSANNKLSAYNNVLMQVSINKGANQIRLYYYADDILLESVISIICIILSFSYLIFQSRKKDLIKL